MKLKPTNNFVTHISHFHHLVSAYETNKDTVEWLVDIISRAIVEARQTEKSVIVDQDSMEHIFVVYPTGSITLYREICTYEVVE